MSEDKEKADESAGSTFLDGQILIAMPGMRDPRFHRSVVFLCAHSEDGAMGLIVNRRTDGITLKDLFERLEIEFDPGLADTPIHYGGPVETHRGFVLHSNDYASGDATLEVNDQASMTATLDILHAIGSGTGPRDAVLALGYAGWGAGQLEGEIQGNGWLACAPDRDLLFGPDDDGKWERALAKLGVDPALLSQGGSA